MNWSNKLAAQARISQIPLAASMDNQLFEQALAWARGADYPQYHSDFDWLRSPVIIHPLSGQDYRLSHLSQQAKQKLLEQAAARFCKNNDRLNSLALWRFAAELPQLFKTEDPYLEKIWGQIPADPHVPDQSLWERMDLVSGFVGAISADPQGEMALLAMSIGPVQPFIATARSTSDLWAGSHLLSYLSWCLMKPLANQLGPDSILFPRLRGIPLVDLWLVDQGLPRDWFKGEAWFHRQSDANPLFIAAIPNRFVAVVPLSQAKEIAQECAQAVRQTLKNIADQSLEYLLNIIDENPKQDFYCFAQMERQLKGFPEVHWAITPLNLASKQEKSVDTQALRTLMQNFIHPQKKLSEKDLLACCNGLDWTLFNQEQKWSDFSYQPHASVLYPAFFDLNERLLAAAKSLRPFEQAEEKGWHCSLSGEGEYLALSPEEVQCPYGQRKNSLWAKVRKLRPDLAKDNEYLSALPTIKRLWPKLFIKRIDAYTSDIKRFNITNTTLSLVKPLLKLKDEAQACDQLENWIDDLEKSINLSLSPVALPARLHQELGGKLHRLPSALEVEDKAAQVLRKKLLEILNIDHLETYYGLLLLDGDRMGKILSGDPAYAISYQDSIHPQLKAHFQNKAPAYTTHKRLSSFSRHQAISGALNDFALHVVPYLIERHYGRLIYAGGDDVLALLPSSELLKAAYHLRQAYTGRSMEEGKLSVQSDFAQFRQRLLRTMGQCTSVSAGLVIAHHMTPLSAAIAALRSAEKAAKNEGGRDALQIQVLKRAGGHLKLTLSWSDLDLLQKTIAFLSHPSVSRQAAYHTLNWLKDLPQEHELLESLLYYQFKRQSNKDQESLPALCHELACWAQKQTSQHSYAALQQWLAVAEFLSRNTRMGE